MSAVSKRKLSFLSHTHTGSNENCSELKAAKQINERPVCCTMSEVRLTLDYHKTIANRKASNEKAKEAEPTKRKGKKNLGIKSLEKSS